jgi:DNA-binding Lrp family transcriptional regulator
MITAIVLIEVERGQTAAAGQALARLPSVADVYSVSGEYDLVAIVRVDAYEQMAEVVPRRIAAVPGVARTHTLMTFQHYQSA